jgi:alkanesulfonate monooxygenase SsuD/methylene tetrahydromethanopterin reductase-like flavin-dependent oxidoreductase (luciferase family)
LTERAFGLRVGISTPQFRHQAAPAIEAARRAEALGLDGVFVFDHLWPLGRPDRPALHSTTLLGAMVAETERITLGTLVARVGLVPDAVLVHTLATLARMAGPERFIAGLGTGDSANRPENDAYGIPFASAADRLAEVIVCARLLRAAGVRTWIGGRSPAIRRAATEADGWNGWGLPLAEWVACAAELQPTVERTWAGQVSGDAAEIALHLRAVADAGASWAICAPIDGATVETVAEAAAAAR